jgi:hypothetical protein
MQGEHQPHITVSVSLMVRSFDFSCAFLFVYFYAKILPELV